MFSSLATGTGKTWHFWSSAVHRRLFLALFPREMKLTLLLSVYLISRMEKSACLYPAWVGNCTVISSGFRCYGICMQCGWSVPEPQKKLWLDRRPLKAESLLSGWWAICELFCLSGTCLRGDILDCLRASFQKWTAVCNPSFHSFGKGQDMHMGDQDCRMLCKASQSCHTDRVFYANDSQWDTNPRSNQSLVVPVFIYDLFPSYSALAKWAKGHNSYSTHCSMWAYRHICTHLVNERELTCLLLRDKTSKTNEDKVDAQTITRR